MQVEFFDRFRVSELTNLLTTELAAVRSVVLDNVSRDRGFRSISEVLGTFFILFKLAPRLAPVLGILITSVSIGAGKEHISAGRGRELYGNVRVEYRLSNQQRRKAARAWISHQMLSPVENLPLFKRGELGSLCYLH